MLSSLRIHLGDSVLVQLRTKVTGSNLREILGKRPSRDHYDILWTGEGSVYKPNGERLFTVVKQAIPSDVAERTYPFFHGLKRFSTSNRGLYAGEDLQLGNARKDGSRSKTAHTMPIASVVVGSLDRTPRIPYCRQAASVMEDPEGWKVGQELARAVDRVFQEYIPDRYATQMKEAAKTPPAFTIPGTAFTSLTVNNSFAGAYHFDKGDLKTGFGCMAVLRRGYYRGCELVMPAYRVAVDLEDRDVILFDPHEAHGNVPFQSIGAVGHWERISIVHYFRAKMVNCGSPAEELARTKARGVVK